MVAKLLEALLSQNSESGKSSSDFDMDAFRRKTARTVRTAFRTMDEKSKQEFLAWLSAVRSIRNTDQSYREKEIQLSELRNTETALMTLKAILDAMVRNAPEENQKDLKSGVSGIGMAASLMKWRIPPMAMVLVGQALPKFLLAPQFEIIATFLEQELQEVLKELGGPPAEGSAS